MTDALKRIEEKHSGTVHSDTLTVCDFCHRRHPCDVVKLARALIGNIHRGHRPECTTKMVGKPNDLSFCDCGYAEAERTLEEVAGEEEK